MLAPAPLERPAVFAVIARPNSLAKLASLQAEARELVRLSALLDRSLVIAAALAAAAMATGFAFFAPATPVWLLLLLAGSGALAAAYIRTVRAPFERAHLLSFREDMKAVLLYAGAVWGTGGWFVLPSGTGVFVIVAFAALPVGAIAALSRDRDLALLFGVPVATLVSFASVLRPFSGAGLDAGLILIACGLAGFGVLTAKRRFRTAARLPSFNEIKA